jgi:hypothetical protein
MILKQTNKYGALKIKVQRVYPACESSLRNISSFFSPKELHHTFRYLLHIFSQHAHVHFVEMVQS